MRGERAIITQRRAVDRDADPPGKEEGERGIAFHARSVQRVRPQTEKDDQPQRGKTERGKNSLPYPVFLLIRRKDLGAVK